MADLNLNKVKDKVLQQNGESVSLEEQLSGLALEKGQARTNMMARLILQGLQKNDNKVLDTALDRSDQELIDSTVKVMPVEAVVPLLKTLQNFVNSRGMVKSAHAKWLQSVVSQNSGFLTSVPECQDLLTPLCSVLEARTTSHHALLQIRGKLDLLVDQKKGQSNQVAIESQALLVYQEDSDNELSDVLDDLLMPGSDTDDNWVDDQDEESEEDDEDVKSVDENNENDV